MMRKKYCNTCSVPLKKDETALSQKMLGRKTTLLFCVPCLATELDCDIDDLIIKIQEFKEHGCALFL